MTRLCCRCQLPAAAIGRAIAATSADGGRHAVVGICTRCTAALAKLPGRSSSGLFGKALDRALDDPGKYLARLFPDIGACELAVGMLGHPDWAAVTVEALGWSAAAVRPSREFRG